MHQVTGAGRQHLTLALTMVSLWSENRREVVEGAVDVEEGNKTQLQEVNRESGIAQLENRVDSMSVDDMLILLKRISKAKPSYVLQKNKMTALSIIDGIIMHRGKRNWFNLLVFRGGKDNLFILLVFRGRKDNLFNLLVLRGGKDNLFNLFVFRGGKDNWFNLLVFRGGKDNLINLLVFKGGQDNLINLLVFKGGQDNLINLLVFKGGQDNLINLLVFKGGQDNLINLLELEMEKTACLIC
ncbi:unnamed protein product [Mytilus edulis]|uniref:Uncharacterized protein n=1 Tax=Mytilus edulis TaxID=6550 RepID=A0A8S3RAX6_MYTED|nr:unnamed protein product [Mytilus edulis]